MLFTLVNLSRHLKLDPEQALRKATAKFERRFRQMEQDQPEPLDTLDDDALEAAWQQAKGCLRSRCRNVAKRSNARSAAR